jgi:hypothetical protein
MKNELAWCMCYLYLWTFTACFMNDDLKSDLLEETLYLWPK